MAVRLLRITLLSALAWSPTTWAADRVVLKDGFELVGDVEKLEQRIVVRTGAQIYLLGIRQVQQAKPADDVSPPIRLTLPPPLPPTGKVLESISGVRNISEFDEFGRRTCVVLDGAGAEVAVHQQATEIYPTHVVVVGLNRAWLTRASLSRIPAKPLLAMLRRSIDAENLTDRLKVAQFLLQAERFAEARAELREIEEKFPDAKQKSSEVHERLEIAVAARSLALARRAVAVGQPARAQEILASLPAVEASSELQGEIVKFRDDQRSQRDALEQTKSLLKATRQKAGVSSDVDQATLDRALEELTMLASPTSLARLEPFRGLSQQPSTAAAEQAALAISGWVLGAELASKDLQAAIQTWRQYEILRESLLAESAKVPDLLSQFRKAGGKADVAAAMAPQLTAPQLPADGAGPHVFTLAVRDRPPIRYHVLAPPEYDRTREYPAVVTLFGQGGSPKRQLELWGPMAAEHGVLLIAPEYLADASAGYRYSTDEHFTILAMLSDAKRRLAIDGDRVFLSGHGMGAYAAWDVGMSHPDQFAGLIPISGPPAGVCKHYGPNLKHLSVFTVDGSIAHGTATATEALVTRWQAMGHNLVYAIYPGRGPESYVSEFPVVFDWMKRQRRPAAPTDVDGVSARQFDRRFYWMEVDSLSPSAVTAPELVDQVKVRPARINGKVVGGESVQINVALVEGLTVLLSPRLVQLDNPNLTVRVNRRLIHRGPLEADLETLVREMRRTGDRKALVACRIEVKSLSPRRP